MESTSSSYRTIFKSSALIGGVQVISIVLGIIRTKAMALFLGPVGVGLTGLYTSATDLIGTFTRMGIDSSGVRQIAEAAGTKDDDKIARTVSTLRRISLISGVLGMSTVLILCVPLNRLTFGDRQPVWGMALVSLALLFSAVTAGQEALLKGLRQLKKLASSQVLGALFSTIASITIIYFLRKNGIALFLVAISAFTVLTSWWYSRQVRVKHLRLSPRELYAESRMLLGMGLAFMLSALFVAGTGYTTRLLILRQLGNEAVGLYQATWTLSSIYVSFVLNAMRVDFYPRLTAMASDNEAVNRLVNEQTEMGILIAVPGVLATITLAPVVLSIFYSREFLAATEIIRWQSMGVALRVVSWPMGFIQLAKGKGTIFIITELAGSLLYILFILVGIRIIGLEGVGIASVLLYLCSIAIMLYVTHSLSDFKWSKRSVQLLTASLSIVVFTFFSIRVLSNQAGFLIGIAVTIGATIAALYYLQKLLGFNLRTWISQKTNFR